MTKLEKYQHHHKRLHQLIDETLRLNRTLYNEANGYSNIYSDPASLELRRRLTRLHRLCSKAEYSRERYAERCSFAYRACPY